MIYPENFEQKIGFSDVRTLLKGRCFSTLGTEWVDNHLVFLSSHAEVISALEEADEFLDECMAQVFHNLKEVKRYFKENLDASGMSDEELLEACEVFPLPDGRYLVVEG